MLKKWKKMSQTRLIALSFFCVILAGTFLLTLPWASRTGEWTSPLNALFTATSATCVTGLIVYDTYCHWSLFGQIVIICLIQIGGLGLMTIISLLAVFTKRRIGLGERRLLMISSGNMRMSGVIRLIQKVAVITFVCEGIGALVLACSFVPQMGIVRGCYNAIFHSISAFCNAGFDLMGRFKEGSSLALYEQNVAVMLPLAILIVVGGIGFQVWSDLHENGFHVKKYSLHTKVALLSTGALLFGGWLLYFIFENKYHLNGMTLPEKLLSTGFTTRTAGFAGFDLSQLSQSGSMLTIILMLIGGCPGSTAGGIKATTIAVMVMSVIGMSRGDTDITVFKRRLNKELIKHAAVICFVYVSVVLAATMTICTIEHASLASVLFETSSAMGTAGLSQGLTAQAGDVSKVILIVLMYGGRIGGLSLLSVFAERKKEAPHKRPAERIMIG